jgi:hypothetical protein
MGVDAEMVFTMTQEPTEKRLREIQYQLMERVGKEIFWRESVDDSGQKQPQMFLEPWFEEEYSCFDGPRLGLRNMVRVKIWSRYYGEGYERGPGLQLAAAMLVLLSQPDVDRVFYGGDSSGIEGEDYTRERVHELIDYYCRFGHESYRRPGFQPHGERTGEPPKCTYCHIEMIRSGYGQHFASFFCSGCGETLKLGDADYDKWTDGSLRVGEFPRFNGVAQIEDKELF